MIFRNGAGTLTKTVFYYYDAFDRRIAKDDDGDGVDDRGERFVYDGGDLVLKTDANGNVLHRYLHGPAHDQLFADEDALGEILWALADHQGTVRDWVEHDSTTDVTTVANHLDYDAFGNIVFQSDPTHVPQFGFTGQDWDADVELYLYSDGTPGGRWYHPRLGRFTKPDEKGFNAGDANLYRYVGNGPTNAIDPSGMEVKVQFPPPSQYIEYATGRQYTFEQLQNLDKHFRNGSNGRKPTENAIRDRINTALKQVRDDEEYACSLLSNIASDVLQPSKRRGRGSGTDIPISMFPGARAHARTLPYSIAQPARTVSFPSGLNFDPEFANNESALVSDSEHKLLGEESPRSIPETDNANARMLIILMHEIGHFHPELKLTDPGWPPQGDPRRLGMNLLLENTIRCDLGLPPRKTYNGKEPAYGGMNLYDYMYNNEKKEHMDQMLEGRQNTKYRKQLENLVNFYNGAE